MTLAHQEPPPPPPPPPPENPPPPKPLEPCERGAAVMPVPARDIAVVKVRSNLGVENPDVDAELPWNHTGGAVA